MPLLNSFKQLLYADAKCRYGYPIVFAKHKFLLCAVPGGGCLVGNEVSANLTYLFPKICGLIEFYVPSYASSALTYTTSQTGFVAINDGGEFGGY